MLAPHGELLDTARSAGRRAVDLFRLIPIGSAGMTDHRSFTLDDLLPSSWDRKIVLDLVDELATLPGEAQKNIDEIRRVLVLKSYRELFLRLQTARKNKSSQAAVRTMAMAVRQFGLERPALFAASLRKPRKETTELGEACRRMHELLVQVFAECGAYGQAAEHAIRIFQNLVRGFVLNELLHSSLCSDLYDATYEAAIDLFIAGLPALFSPDLRTNYH